MLIKLPHSVPGLGLGKVTRLIAGMPQSDLAGFWPCQGTGLAPVDGVPVYELQDASGLGNHARLRSGWAAPTQRANGIEVAGANGTVLQTEIPANSSVRRLTVFVAARNRLPGNENNVFNTFVGASKNLGMDDPASTHQNNPALVMNYNGSNSTGRWQIFDNAADLIGTGSIVQDTSPDFDQATIAAIEIDAVGDRAALHVLDAPTVAADGSGNLSAFYDGITDQGVLEFGIWPHSVARSAAPALGEIFAVAAYLRSFTEKEAQEHMAFMKTIIEARGVAF